MNGDPASWTLIDVVSVWILIRGLMAVVEDVAWFLRRVLGERDSSSHSLPLRDRRDRRESERRNS